MQYEKTQELTIAYSIGVLIKAKREGILTEIAPLFKVWEETGRLWIGEDLKKEALRRAGE